MGPPLTELAVPVLLAVVSGAIVWKNLWRVVLFVWPPSLELELDDPSDQIRLPAPLEGLAAEVQSLGFVVLGSRLERPRLSRAEIRYDYAKPGERVFATLFLGRDGQPRVDLLTPTPGGGLVITGNYHRPGHEVPGRYRTGGLENASVKRLLRAHLKRIEGLDAEGEFTPEARLRLARSWYSGYGKREVRADNFRAVLWSAVALGMLGAILSRMT